MLAHVPEEFFDDLFRLLGISVVVVIGLVLLAFLVGWLITRLRKRKDDQGF